jgi:hypothetical protein
MGIGEEPGTKPAAHGMKGRARAAEALHLHLQDERSGSASGPVDEFYRWLLVQWVEALHLVQMLVRATFN